MPQTKYIFILGSVLSGLGKGIVTSAIGKAFQVRNKDISVLKIDPYLNIDAGTMSPIEHGEVFVTDDGGELDEDFGHYERFLGRPMSRNQNITSGQIYYSVISKERKGEYLGKTVQVVPHIIDEILHRIDSLVQQKESEIMIVEVGGTIGDIESRHFLEAIRQLNRNIPEEDSLFVLLTYVPFPNHLQEHKTKPTQMAVRELRALGITPDVIITRSSKSLDKKTLNKIAFFADVPESAVLDIPDVSSVFEVPQILDNQGLMNLMIKYLQLDLGMPNWSKINTLLNNLSSLKDKIIIGIPGKYTDLVDSYISVNEALKHAAWVHQYDIELKHIPTELLEESIDNLKLLEDLDGILVPGGFGDRGTEGKILAIKYARENGIPFLGICLGFQLAVVEYARNVKNLPNAHSTEMNSSTADPVISLQESQQDLENLGGTMRLGSSEVVISKKSMIYQLYGKEKINERHRHRYEVNKNYFDIIQDDNFTFTGFYGELAETFELSNHIFFMGVQFHPEFKSTPWASSPPYQGLIDAAIKRKQNGN